jgi:protein-L-isoaspartate(D-aspartate) O-methyltransferase
MIGSTPQTELDPYAEAAAAARAAMVSDLIAAGELLDSQWQEVFLAVPRHRLVPRYFNGEAIVEPDSDREEWLASVYSDTTLITQRDDHAITSSGTMPSLVATMLQALDVQDGHRVLQIATGTGYTAALLCERLGSDAVTSIEIDPKLSALASRRLRDCGYTPTMITGDARHGYPARAPYDRVIATFGVERVPLEWIAQVRPGGVIVAPVATALARLTVAGPEAASGRLIGAGYFIRHRYAEPAVAPAPLVETAPSSPRRAAVSSAVYFVADFRFFLDLTTPGLVAAFRDDPLDLTLIGPNGSHSHITPDGWVTSAGPADIWDQVEQAYALWGELGCPGRVRFGLSVTAERQTMWLDDPDSPHQWGIHGLPDQRR